MSDQASALAAALPEAWAVYVAMRYGQPKIADVMSQVEADGIDDLVVVPMYPQFNRATSGWQANTFDHSVLPDLGSPTMKMGAVRGCSR